MTADQPADARSVRSAGAQASGGVGHVPTWSRLADSRVGRLFRPALIDKIDRDHQQSDAAFRRRRIVVAVVVVLGATLLGISLSVRPADPAFYPLTLGLAALWVAGGFASGPLHLGWEGSPRGIRRPIVVPVLLGLAAGAVFVVGALIVRDIGPVHRLVNSVLAHARFGSTPVVLLIALLNGVAEEVFFRGALFAAIGRKRPVLISTIVYTLATLATGNFMLVFAALTLGLVLGLERRATGGILAPILTHVTWSLVMFFALPPLFA
ncbi:membrane protease YdiL (CAAX protease family) [Nakamurella sp. UYEF19]|uniref:CPBP family intramembrane glutamic endopeptidase n=1 Tax=Nakamurella sp. UYEF19 TaxID=1756392 RepID=UPI003395D31A